MNRIGIVTSNATFLNNYGAALQAYATNAQLFRWGYSSVFINYTYRNGDRMIRDHTVNRLGLGHLSRLFSAETSVRDKYRRLIHRKGMEKLLECFRAFRTEHLPLHSKELMNFEQLKANPPDCDAYICGSDQIWNPYVHGEINDPGHFLDFAEEGRRRIAYAPSLGISTWPDACKSDLKYFLDQFHALSVREATGSRIIKEVTGLDVPVMLDPVLMADSEVWDQICKTPPSLPEEYILCYSFDPSPDTLELLDQLHKKHRLPVLDLPISRSAYSRPYQLRFDIGPAEFVGAIRNAKLVVTDSFHATAFSIMNQVPFFTSLRAAQSSGESMASRISDLLQTFELSHRIFTSMAKLDPAAIYDVDFGRSKRKLEALRTEAQDYLRKALTD